MVSRYFILLLALATVACISLGPGSSNIVSISICFCGPGHGISVDSLGQYPNEEDVVGLTVRNCTFTGTTNGLRIKAWEASPASTNASSFTFDDIVMNNVYNPIIIDQEYCPYKSCNLETPSRVKIDNVSFKNIRVIWPSLTYSNTLFFSSPHSKRKDEELKLLKPRKYNVEYVVKDNEAEESLVRGFRSKVLKAGILQECKRRRFFENKQDKKKRKARDSAKKNRSRRHPPIAKQRTSLLMTLVLHLVVTILTGFLKNLFADSILFFHFITPEYA
ncbi:hypothetical protein MRB53_004488 [Persea americana]|uniref:Uncharacterized protein n=1 Tax=Persea americana TaxID=3435 RepID=A0ACC2MAP2_PERAE|nr:hypothetical protein MRB53_004488 [Persea americana]